MREIALLVTAEELRFLQRLVGHHVTGDGISPLYDEIHRVMKLHQVTPSDKPLIASMGNQELYPERPMVTATGEMY